MGALAGRERVVGAAHGGPWGMSVHGTRANEPGIYELSIVQFPYKVLLEVSEQDVWVLHIRYTSRPLKE
jgi:hypothetical protein